ncbi:MAG: PKD domain-containing protein [Methylococcaceae bacterium]|nr:PKD domain-containing protein [Methylococcaceae bacterium]
MKKHLLLGAILGAAHPVFAAINDGTRGDPSELFIAVFDEQAQKSYYKDLGIGMVQFLQNPAGQFDLSQDPNFAAFLGKPGIVYNLAAFSSLKPDQSNLTSWGYVATSSEGGKLFIPTFTAIDGVRQKIQVYVFDLNAPIPFEPSLAAVNLSASFSPGDLGYFDGTDWNSSMAGAVNGNTTGTLGQPLEFYFVNNFTGDDKGKQVVKLGTWTLSASGQLSFSASGNPIGGINALPKADAGSAQSVSSGVKVALDGSRSADPDNGPSPLTYSWKQVSGPAVTLAGGTTAKPSFTPTAAGVYVFSLTVNDGAGDSSPASVQITVVNQPPVANAGANQNVNTGVVVILDGSKSSDPDNGPSSLTYGWKQTAGPVVTLNGDHTAHPSFTPNDEGGYGFSLTVSDGQDSSSASVTVNASWGTIPHIKLLNVPGVWTLKQAQILSWKSNVDGKLPVSFKFSKDGVKFGVIRSVRNSLGSFSYKFLSKAQLMQGGVLKACVTVPRKVVKRVVTPAVTVCDSANVTVKAK